MELGGRSILIKLRLGETCISIFLQELNSCYFRKYYCRTSVKDVEKTVSLISCYNFE